MQAKARNDQHFIPQNLGWLDRLLRFLIGTAILSGFITWTVLGDPAWLSDGYEIPDWAYALPFISVYAFLTAILGADPVYGLLRIRSCGTSARNPCGTLPFELDAAMGNRPVPDNDIQHSLGNSRHPHSKNTK